MEGNGPSSGRPRHLGAILASTDAVSLDAVAAEIMSIEAGAVTTTLLAEQRGLGMASFDGIETRGAQIADLKAHDFKKPPIYLRNAAMALLPSRAINWIINTMGTFRPTVNGNQCVLCEECVINCPVKAMQRVDDSIVPDHSKCIGCFCCEEACPHKALAMKRPLTARLIRRAVDMLHP